jgi:hypothetical protein
MLSNKVFKSILICSKRHLSCLEEIQMLQILFSLIMSQSLANTQFYSITAKTNYGT